MSPYPNIKGFCPMGCGETLFLGNAGYVTCAFLGCPNPAAVSEILDCSETEHIVIFGGVGFTIRHPLRERLNEELFDCALHAYCQSLAGPPRLPGRYRVVRGEAGTWSFLRLGEGDWGKWTGGGHLYADTAEELHEFALRLLLKRLWFQSRPGRPELDHYDLTSARRAQAILLGAVPESVEEGSERRKRQRESAKEGKAER